MRATIHRIGVLVTVAAIVAALAPSALMAAPQFSDWSAAENMGPVVNSAFQDFGPAISTDGLSLYLSSDRPGGVGGFDLWVAERSIPSAPWGAPRNLGAVINTGASDNVPALSRDGHWLFFISDRPGGFGAQDIWVSWREHVHDNFGWQAAFNLGAGVNSPFGDVNPAYLETDGGAMLFFTSNRPGGPGLFDIYVSHLSSGRFGTATVVGELSGADGEQRPTIRFDGLEMIFQVNPLGPGSGDLWVSTRDDIASLWFPPIRVDALNTTFADQQPYLAADRQTLLFASNRPGGYGALDLYVATRNGPGRSNQP